MNTSTIQIRINQDIKNKAQKTFGKLGFDLSTGIKIYLNQVAIRGDIPFELKTENGYSLKEELDMINETDIAKKGKRYLSVKKMHDDILKVK